MDPETRKLALEVKDRLRSLQAFDSGSLERRTELGNSHFEDIVPHADQAIKLFRELPEAALDALPRPLLQQLDRVITSTLQGFDSIKGYDPQKSASSRKDFESHVRRSYDESFPIVHPIVAYFKSKEATSEEHGMKTRELIDGSRAALENLNKKLSSVEEELSKQYTKREVEFAELIEGLKQDSAEQLRAQKVEAEAILADIKKVAAEQGVSQQADYYKKEADNHDEAASDWKWATILSSAFLGVAAIGSIFLHKLCYIAPANVYESVQLVVGKILFFGALSYMVILCSRNFIAHKHNGVVNRHRQNALMTFTSLVDAVGSPEAKDVVLSYASSCIFSPQETGYTKGDSGKSGSMVELIPKTLMSGISKQS